MTNLLNTLFRTLLLDDAAFQEWRERPNLFLRGILLILVISLVTSVVAFATNLVNLTKPVDTIINEIDEGFDQAMRVMEEFASGGFFGIDDPEFERGMEEAMASYEESMAVNREMIRAIMQVPAPLPRGVSGFLQALGTWLSGALASIGGWMVYGVLVLIAANLLGGGARLPDFLGMVSLYTVPTLLGLLGALLGIFRSIPYLGVVLGALSFLLGLAAVVWVIVIYIKAVSVVSGLDTGRSIVAVIAPPIVLAILAFLIALLWAVWIAILVSIA